MSDGSDLTGAGGGGQEFYEKKTHGTSDHSEEESHERGVR